MPKKDLSEIVCIIDRSGSMKLIKDDAIGGFNQFLEDQKKLPGEATLTFVQFNCKVVTIHENLPIKDVPGLNNNSYVPFGSTSLFDAIGTTVESVGKRLANTPEELRPEHVIFAILTDGAENSSEKFKERSVIKEMITHQQDKYSWEFIFLAANQDAFAEGMRLGIKPGDTYNFRSTSEGVRAAYANMSKSTMEKRGY